MRTLPLVCLIVISSLFISPAIFGPTIIHQMDLQLAAPEIPISVPLHQQTSQQDGISQVGSTNWGGYVVTGPAGEISSVKMSWIVPAVTCSALTLTYSVNWVGIDGFGSNTVEQIGTSSDCSLLGGAYYNAWYEFYPGSSVTLSETVHAGDIISAAVTYQSSSDLYIVSIQDNTQHWAFETSSTSSSAQDSSAEWIVERPAICVLTVCTLTSLANFGTFYSGPKYSLLPKSQSDVATINGKTGSIGSFASVSGDSVYSVTMYSSNSPTYPLATPSSLHGGRSFTMQWDASS